MTKPSHGLDGVLLLAVVGLTLFGFMMIASSSSVLAERFQGDLLFYFKHQVLYGGIVGLIVFLVGITVPYRVWHRFALPALGISVLLLIMVFIPGLSVASGGAARWIGLGPITIQPSEITKLAFIVYLAALLEAKGEDVRSWRQSVVPFLGIMGVISTLIILQPDLGTLISIVLISAAMAFAAGFRLRHLSALALAGLAVFAVFINVATYRLNRIIVYLHPELDPQGLGYQINQALLAVGTGGIWGLGFGRSRQKYQFLPEPAGDSIFAIIAEELGLVRTSLVVALFALIAWRGFSIALRAPDIFGRLIAVGITSWIVSQAFINMGSIMGVTPLTGIPLPFISYGGSALATMLFATGVLLNISRYRT